MAEAKNEQIKIYIIVALIAIAAIVAYFRFFHSKKPGQPLPAPASQVAAFNIPQVKPLALPQKPPPDISARLKDFTNIRDIFVPLAQPVIIEKPVAKPKNNKPKPSKPLKPRPKPLPRMRLSGTLTAGNHPIAIIEDQFLRIGDTILDFRVVEIGQNLVRLVSMDRQIILKVNENTQ